MCIKGLRVLAVGCGGAACYPARQGGPRAGVLQVGGIGGYVCIKGLRVC